MEAFVLASASPGALTDLARPVAGAPLLIRQLEWLRMNGVGRVVVNRVARGGMPKALVRQVLAQAGVNVTWIPSARPLTRDELARRLGIREGVVIEIPHGLLGDVPLAGALALAQRDGTNVRVHVGALSLEVCHIDRAPRALRDVEGEGWLADATSEAGVHALVEELLVGTKKGVEVRGSEMKPGVFRARGAVVVDGAELIAPVYLGPQCFVDQGARLGPGAVIGERAIVERHAHVEHARIADGTVVGQGLRIERACAEGGRIERHSGRVLSLGDPLLLGDRGDRAVASRLLAAAAVGAVAPCAVLFERQGVASLARRLARVVDGRGAWFGVRDEDDPDAVVFNVLARLVPPDALDEERIAARAFYQARKSAWLDAKLAAAMLLGRETP